MRMCMLMLLNVYIMSHTVLSLLSLLAIIQRVFYQFLAHCPCLHRGLALAVIRRSSSGIAIHEHNDRLYRSVDSHDDAECYECDV